MYRGFVHTTVEGEIGYTHRPVLVVCKMCISVCKEPKLSSTVCERVLYDSHYQAKRFNLSCFALGAPCRFVPHTRSPDIPARLFPAYNVQPLAGYPSLRLAMGYGVYHLVYAHPLVVEGTTIGSPPCKIVLCRVLCRVPSLTRKYPCRFAFVPQVTGRSNAARINSSSDSSSGRPSNSRTEHMLS